MNITGYFKKLIKDAVRDKFSLDLDDNLLKVERAPEGQPGDYGTNAGFIAAKALKKPPLEIAQEISGAVGASPFAGEVTVVKPGYLNWALKNDCYEQELKNMLADENYFHNNSGAGMRINIEFVSANPTGPLNVVSGRAAAYGDTLANIFSCCGYSVAREFYINDYGRQLGLFAQSLEERYLENHGVKKAEIPEGGYNGDYVAKIARQIDVDRAEAHKEIMNAREMKPGHDTTDYFRLYGLAYVKNWQSATLKNFGVIFDVWFPESSLYEEKAGKSRVEKALDKLKAKGLLFEDEGALWFKTTAFGDDKDRVIKKSNSEYAYLAGDIAYMQDKLDRGFDRLINILGPDHHGYVKRMEAIIKGLGYDGSMLDVIILQQVNLLEAGEKMKMSKRDGTLVLLDELIDAVGPDAARYYFLMRNYNSHLDFDIALAKEQSDKNPVYYVQYAYARVCHIFSHAEEKQVRIGDHDPAKDINLSSLEKEESGLILGMIGIQEEIRDAAAKRSPSVLIQAVYGLVSDFHSFYNKHRVVTDDKAVTLKRLFIMLALKKTLEKCFKIIGIKAIEKM